MSLVAAKFDCLPHSFGYDSRLPRVIRVSVAAKVSGRVVYMIVATQLAGRTIWLRIQLSGATEMAVRVVDEINTAGHSAPKQGFLVQSSGATEIGAGIVYLVGTARYAGPSLRLLVQMTAATEVGFSEIQLTVAPCNNDSNRVNLRTKKYLTPKH